MKAPKPPSARLPARGGPLRIWEWLTPYASWITLGLGGSLAWFAAGEEVATQRLQAHRLAAVLTTLGGGALAAQLLLALARRRTQAAVATVYSGLVVAVAVVIASTLIAHEPPAQSRLQASLREVLERRATESSRTFHGTLLREKTNHNGWADDEPRPGASRRFAFVGDSFLEVRSSQNLARQVETLLGEAGIDAEILNFSIQDTDLVEYRHRLYEIALPAAPERVFVFLFALNDLAADYRYEPYLHPRFWVSLEAERIARERSPELGARLKRLRVNEEAFESRVEFFSLVDGAPADRELAYLAALAYSHPPDAESSLATRVAHLARETAAALWRTWRFRAGSGDRRGAAEGRAGRSGCVVTPWVDLWNDYQAIFELPATERERAIGEFVGRRYCGRDDPAPFVRHLRRQSREFRDYLVEDVEMPYFLFPALAEAVREEESRQGPRFRAADARSAAARAGERWARPVDPVAVEKAAAEYEKLIVEMRDAAARLGIGFTLVLIPEPSMVDPHFRDFWSGLCRFEERFETQHALHRALAESLEGKVDVVDLAAVAGLLDNGYWPIDGHFNERGNRDVARRMTKELLARDSGPRTGRRGF